MVATHTPSSVIAAMGNAGTILHGVLKESIMDERTIAKLNQLS
jgi:hypothetical protein